MSTITAGLERVVCESCGHMSLRNLKSLSGHVERERFARPADTAAEVNARRKAERTSAAAGIFAREERLHVRSRYETHPLLTASLAG